jgi:hypothetical protein
MRQRLNGNRGDIVTLIPQQQNVIYLSVVLPAALMRFCRQTHFFVYRGATRVCQLILMPSKSESPRPSLSPRISCSSVTLLLRAKRHDVAPGKTGWFLDSHHFLMQTDFSDSRVTTFRSPRRAGSLSAGLALNSAVLQEFSLLRLRPTFMTSPFPAVFPSPKAIGATSG